MDFKFENYGTNTYLVYELKSDDVINAMSLGMLINNKISGLATTVFTQMNTTQYIKYDVSTKMSAKQIFSGIVNRKRLLGIFSGIVDALLSAEDYMIDLDNIILDLDYIFSDITTCDTVLICLPIETDNFTQRDLKTFFRNIMFNIRVDQTENCDYVARIISYLNSVPMFSINDFKKLLDEVKQNQSANSFINNTVTVKKVTPHSSSVQNGVFNQADYANNGAKFSNNVQQNSVQVQTVRPSANQNRNDNQQNQQFARQQTFNQPAVNNGGQQVKQPTTYQQPPKSYYQTSESSSTEKPMTFLNLMMHYNKENAALYKKQRAMKKGKSGQSVSKMPSNISANTTPSNVSFAIPGQPIQHPVATQNRNVAVQNTSQQSSSQSGMKNNFFTTPQQNHYAESNINNQNNMNNAQSRVSMGNSHNNPMGSSVSSRSFDFGETTELGGAGFMPTMDLSDVDIPKNNIKKKAFLMRKSNSQKINIDENVFTIGRENGYVSYCIEDNIYIGRVHATIIHKNEKYYIIDNNSRNHTYVNGNLITSSTEIEINNGDSIKLANEEFEFKYF